MHTKGAIAFSVLFSRVTAWVNRLFEVSESWISEAALLFFPGSCFKTQPLVGKNAL